MSDFAVPNAKPGKCEKCNGSGVYRWGGAVINGQFVGKSGPCHSCRGTGRQSRSDIGRNTAYNRFKLSDMAASMAAARDWEG
jgi:DnaJ-class molecular chaperone